MDLEQAEMELKGVENLLSVFWGFFVEERPLDKNADTTAALWFLQSCKPYESVLNAAWDKVRKVRADVDTAMKKGGDAA